ncbi:uncharacterized protein MELLADRAFT_114630 [Melampsora larici-populina 98AG31]|uniref:Uncharacterized protein n=1 Tax=Melampsora larici-populina (strain 98AG31 / pathotype 3-4-7) TaxID=747676 RepID=F4SE71_MELLP|nr:uncharacterized protein MELLADRAFT_114630 [Melampsora larici-populina 98AG31]EGF97055.1 hypothetical protein MELLADRAFT_114630 [Melampsora larici-populina 98AG31]
MLTQRLENEIPRTSALKVVTNIARSSVPKGEAFDQWIQDILPLTAAFLRRKNRALKISCFECLDALLQCDPGKLRLDTIHSLVYYLHPLINSSDPHLLPLTFKTLGLSFPVASDLTSTDRYAIKAPDNASNLRNALVSTVDTSIALSQAKSSVNFNPNTGSGSNGNHATGLQSYQTYSCCIGELGRVVFLPVIFQLMQGDNKQRYIVLQALEEDEERIGLT